MQTTTPYIVTQTDYFGNDYTSTVYLTDREAKDRIVDGRLLTAAHGRARNYKELWRSFKLILAQGEAYRNEHGLNGGGEINESAMNQFFELRAMEPDKN